MNRKNTTQDLRRLRRYRRRWKIERLFAWLQNFTTAQACSTYFFFAALILAQRALAAARIRAIPVAEMRRFGRASFCADFFCLAQRARWAAAIRWRAAGDILRPLRCLDRAIERSQCRNRL